VKNVSRRTFLGTAIGTGILGSTALAGLPILPKQIQALLPVHDAGNAAQPETQATSTPNVNMLGYDTIPRYLHWSFGDQYRSNPMEAKSSDFKLWFSPVAERRPYDFRAEVFAKCREIDEKRNGKTVALCHGGGESSEVIAHAMKELGIPFDLYFLDTWMLNSAIRKEFVEPLAKKLDVALHTVSVSESFFDSEFVPKDFAEFGADHPNTMLMRYLFSIIPSTHFIVTGAGNLERSGPRTKKIAEEGTIDANIKEFGWTFSSSHVAYYDWANKTNRPGEYYFFHSSPGLLLSALESPQIQRDFPKVCLKGMIYSSFPEISPRGKSTNWEAPEGQVRLNNLRAYIRGISKKQNQDFWKPLIGCNANVASLYLA
jgi:hypothetical protein